MLVRHTARLRASIVVAAHNEERNIAGLLRSILAQDLGSAELSEVVVVASGCTDATHAEVEAVARTDGRVRLLAQPTRLGKVYAINAYLLERDPTADVVVICSADICLRFGCLRLLLEPFARDPALGMTGGRPIPNNRRDTVLGEMVHLLWELHHDRASQSPKLGEIVAIRAAIMRPLEAASPVDEASAEALVQSNGYELRYVPDALVTNHGPERLREYFGQRRRINAGHYWLRHACGYEPSTFDWRSVLLLALRRMSPRQPRRNLALGLAAVVEAAARLTGRIDLVLGRSHSIWKMSESARPRLEGGAEPAHAERRPASRYQAIASAAPGANRTTGR